MFLDSTKQCVLPPVQVYLLHFHERVWMIRGRSRSRRRRRLRSFRNVSKSCQAPAHKGRPAGANDTAGGAVCGKAIVVLCVSSVVPSPPAAQAVAPLQWFRGDVVHIGGGGTGSIAAGRSGSGSNGALALVSARATGLSVGIFLLARGSTSAFGAVSTSGALASDAAGGASGSIATAVVVIGASIRHRSGFSSVVVCVPLSSSWRLGVLEGKGRKAGSIGRILPSWFPPLFRFRRGRSFYSSIVSADHRLLGRVLWLGCLLLWWLRLGSTGRTYGNLF